MVDSRLVAFPPAASNQHLAKCNTILYHWSMDTVLADADVKVYIAANVRWLLERMDRTPYWLAKQTGEWQSTIGNVLHARNVPGAGLLKRIADALEIRVDDLYDSPECFQRRFSETRKKVSVSA